MQTPFADGVTSTFLDTSYYNMDDLLAQWVVLLPHCARVPGSVWCFYMFCLCPISSHPTIHAGGCIGYSKLVCVVAPCCGLASCTGCVPPFIQFCQVDLGSIVTLTRIKPLLNIPERHQHVGGSGAFPRELGIRWGYTHHRTQCTNTWTVYSNVGAI